MHNLPLRLFEFYGRDSILEATYHAVQATSLWQTDTHTGSIL